MNTRPLVTPAGRRRLEARLEQAHRSYQQVVASNADAAEAGDSSVWHDNFAYEENQRLMHQLGRRVRDLRALLDHVEVIAPPDASRVTIGTRVRLRDCESNEDQELLVSGFDDGDPALRRVSYTAPLAASLLGATIGEQRQVSIAGRVRDFEVLSIVTAQEEFS